MNYNTIFNNPTERSRITYSWTWWDGLFSNEELDKMVAYFATQGTERGTTVKADGQGPEEEVRRSNVKFHSPNADTQWIFDKMNWVINEINNRFYGFDLNGYESFQYGEYDVSDAGKYDWHMDMIMGNKRGDNMIETRKLSLSMLLNEPGVDFEGGDFQFNQSSEAKPETPEMKRGRIIAFPSYMLHRVKEVTKGNRKSLVIWVMGPKFK